MFHVKLENGHILQLEAKYGGLEASDVKRLKDTEHEHNRLKPIYADPSLENAAYVIANNALASSDG